MTGGSISPPCPHSGSVCVSRNRSQVVGLSSRRGLLGFFLGLALFGPSVFGQESPPDGSTFQENCKKLYSKDVREQAIGAHNLANLRGNRGLEACRRREIADIWPGGLGIAKSAWRT